MGRVGNAASASRDGGIGAATSGLGRLRSVGRLVGWLVSRLVCRLFRRLVGGVVGGVVGGSGSGGIGDRDRIAALSDGVCLDLAGVARGRLDGHSNSGRSLTGRALSDLGSVRDRGGDRRLRSRCRVGDDLGGIGSGVVGGGQVG